MHVISQNSTMGLHAEILKLYIEVYTVNIVLQVLYIQGGWYVIFTVQPNIAF